MHNINILMTYNYVWFTTTCFNINTLSQGALHAWLKLNVILARHKELPEDDVLTSKHVGANHM